jgi:hypothetical protein
MMDISEDYRIQVLKDLYSVLKDNGLLIVGEDLIPDIFAPSKARYTEVMHKWLEAGLNTKYYDEESFPKLVAKSPFSQVELVRGEREYFWALRK